MYQTGVTRAEKFEAKLNLYLIKERQNQCAVVELLEGNGRSWKSEKPVRIVKELRAGGNGWGGRASWVRTRKFNQIFSKYAELKHLLFGINSLKSTTLKGIR